jgi:hypothetical protein
MDSILFLTLYADHASLKMGMLFVFSLISFSYFVKEIWKEIETIRKSNAGPFWGLWKRLFFRDDERN